VHEDLVREPALLTVLHLLAVHPSTYLHLSGASTCRAEDQHHSADEGLPSGCSPHVLTRPMAVVGPCKSERRSRRYRERKRCEAPAMISEPL
jgi:hypothetical protein